MAMSRQETTDGWFGELERFSALVRSLDPGELGTPSRCEAWSVGDVAAHVSGTLADPAPLGLDADVNA